MLVDSEGKPVATDVSTPDVPSPFEISTVFVPGNSLTVVSMVSQGRRFLMTPGEARATGLLLLLESEAALANATAMRMLTEPSMGGLLPEQAALMLAAMSKTTRTENAIAERESLAQRATAKAPDAPST